MTLCSSIPRFSARANPALAESPTGRSGTKQTTACATRWIWPTCRVVGKRGPSDRWKLATEKAGLAGTQFRDLRAKAGTDKAENTGDIRRAQKQLGHATVVMTEHYVRRRRGDKVTPTK